MTLVDLIKALRKSDKESIKLSLVGDVLGVTTVTRDGESSHTMTVDLDERFHGMFLTGVVSVSALNQFVEAMLDPPPPLSTN